MMVNLISEKQYKIDVDKKLKVSCLLTFKYVEYEDDTYCLWFVFQNEAFEDVYLQESDLKQYQLAAVD
jgi:hypothetical protein